MITDGVDAVASRLFGLFGDVMQNDIYQKLNIMSDRRLNELLLQLNEVSIAKCFGAGIKFKFEILSNLPSISNFIDLLRKRFRS